MSRGLVTEGPVSEEAERARRLKADTAMLLIAARDACKALEGRGGYELQRLRLREAADAVRANLGVVDFGETPRPAKDGERE